MGARQVGKSTLCQQVTTEFGFVSRTLDERDVREQALEDPEGFLAELGDRGVFIDEVQRAPDLLLAIKAVVDRDQRKGQYLLSGSNQPKVSQAVADSLVGRATYRTLRPLTLSELRFDERFPGWSFLFASNENAVIDELERRAAANGPLDWHTAVQAGGFPRALAVDTGQRLRILNDYIEIFSRRDIREIIGIESTSRLEAFVRLSATRTGRALNVAGMANDLGIPVTTVRRWLDVLQRAYLIELVPAYSHNASQRVIKAPKLYSVDPALAMAAARDTTVTGFHLETLVANDLQVWREGGAARGLYHWRLSSGQEVDFILEQDGALLPVEVKATEDARKGDAKHLVTFRGQYTNTPRGVLLSCDPHIRIIKPGIVACPWWSIL